MAKSERACDAAWRGRGPQAESGLPACCAASGSPWARCMEGCGHLQQSVGPPWGLGLQHCPDRCIAASRRAEKGGNKRVEEPDDDASVSSASTAYTTGRGPGYQMEHEDIDEVEAFQAAIGGWGQGRCARRPAVLGCMGCDAARRCTPPDPFGPADDTYESRGTTREKAWEGLTSMLRNEFRAEDCASRRVAVGGGSRARPSSCCCGGAGHSALPPLSRA